MNPLNLFAAVAALLYGMITIILVFAAAACTGSVLGMAAAALAAGATYLYQSVQWEVVVLNGQELKRSARLVLHYLPFVLTGLSLTATLAGA